MTSILLIGGLIKVQNSAFNAGYATGVGDGLVKVNGAGPGEMYFLQTDP